uniref:Uncharacterized protein n=1 Tax=Anguilla anguilla TaxID=7936 RepID=A0A0E9Q9T1_ANGAN
MLLLHKYGLLCVHVGVNACVSQWSAPVESNATRLLCRLYQSLG